MKKSTVLVTVLVLCLIGGVVSASNDDTLTYEELEQRMASCAAIHVQLSRLACYDTLARSLGLTVRTGPLSTGDKGEWRVSITTNPLDDSQTVVLLLDANKATSTWGDSITLVLRCKSNKTEAAVNWHEYLGSEARVTWRIGSGDAKTALWSLSTDHEATFYPSSWFTPDAVVAFIKQLLAVNQFVARVTPYNEDPITAVFDLTGLTNVIDLLQDVCGWQ